MLNPSDACEFDYVVPLRDPVESLIDLRLDRWNPFDGSFGAQLIAQGDERTTAERRRDLRQMVREGFNREGWSWITVIDTPARLLPQADLKSVRLIWQRYADGRTPWPSRTRHKRHG